MLGRVAGGALCSVEEGTCTWTGDALAADGVIDHMVLTEDASLLGVVEIFRYEAVDAVSRVPIGTSRTVATTIDEDLPTRTRQTVSGIPVPKRVIGTMPAPGSVEVGRWHGAVDALLEGDVIDGISLA